MAIDFWEAQRKARWRTAWYIMIFVILTLMVAVAAEVAMRTLAEESYAPPLPYVAIVFLAVTFLVALFQYAQFSAFGGAMVAESVGAVLVDKRTSSFKEQQLLNIVEEVAVAASLPVPPVYILPAKEINAFAAGLTPEDAIVAVTAGTLNLLSRDELQGVIAHEIGHIQNADMLIGMRIAAMVMGFFFVLYIGMRLLQFTNWQTDERDERRGGNPLALAALILLIAGAFTWFAGSVLKCMVSRQREYLADASSVQYTRNPEALANALRKIANEQFHDMPRAGMAYSHLYFEDTSMMSFLFATHPPIEKRIAALEGRT